MINRPGPRLQLHFLTVTLAVSAALVTGCGEPAPSEPPKSAPESSPADPTPKTSSSKPKGKGLDPTANMERDELRAYRKKQREQGKAE